MKKTVIDNIEYRNRNNLSCRSFECFKQTIDFKTFFEAVSTYAKAYKELGVKDGDIVTLCLAGTLDTIINIYALNKIGAVANIVNPNYFRVNSKKYINESNSKLLVILDRFYLPLKSSIEITNVQKIILSSLTEYSSFLFKLLISRKKFNKSDLIDNVEYFSLPDFIRYGKNSCIRLEELPYIPEREACITYSSGTTGNPKGIVLTNDSLNNMIDIYDKKEGFGSIVGDRNLVLIPPMYGTSLCHSINTPLAFGCTTSFQPVYNPSTLLKDLRTFEPKIFVASKAHYIGLMKEKIKKGELSFCKMAFCGGEPLTKSLVIDINRTLKYAGINPLIIGYGLSELGTMCMVSMDIPNRTNESGILLPMIDAMILDPITGNRVKDGDLGELYVSTPAIMKGYFKDTKSTDEFFYIDAEGRKWAKTGDIAKKHFDEEINDDIYDVIGRKKDSFIDKGGNVIYLFEIENFIENLKWVLECEVVSLTINDEIVPIAHIVLKDEFKNNMFDIIKMIDSCCKSFLNFNMVPYAYKLRDNFPTSPISGKRDFETLKYETDNYIVIENDNILFTSLNSKESKENNCIEDVKKLKLSCK